MTIEETLESHNIADIEVALLEADLERGKLCQLFIKMMANTDTPVATYEALIDAGADLHGAHDQAVIVAARYGNFKGVDFLIANGADVNAQEGEALYQSIEINKDRAMLNHLVTLGGDLRAKQCGLIPAAIVNWDWDFLRYLLTNLKGKTLPSDVHFFLNATIQGGDHDIDYETWSHVISKDQLPALFSLSDDESRLRLELGTEEDKTMSAINPAS